jgi:hypothetical protein
VGVRGGGWRGCGGPWRGCAPPLERAPLKGPWTGSPAPGHPGPGWSPSDHRLEPGHPGPGWSPTWPEPHQAAGLGRQKRVPCTLGRRQKSQLFECGSGAPQKRAPRTRSGGPCLCPPGKKEEEATCPWGTNRAGGCRQCDLRVRERSGAGACSARAGLPAYVVIAYFHSALVDQVGLTDLRPGGAGRGGGSWSGARERRPV